MDEQTKAILRHSLIETITKWWNSQTDANLPWVGSNVLAYMADAALTIVFSLKDTERFLIDEGMLKQ